MYALDKNLLDSTPKIHYNGAMNITLKEIPISLHQTLKDLSKLNGRSLSKEIIHILEEKVVPKKIDKNNLLEQIKIKRKQLNLYLTHDEIEKAINNRR